MAGLSDLNKTKYFGPNKEPHNLAWINKKEAEALEKAGGYGKPVKGSHGIPAYVLGMGSADDWSDQAEAEADAAAAAAAAGGDSESNIGSAIDWGLGPQQQSLANWAASRSGIDPGGRVGSYSSYFGDSSKGMPGWKMSQDPTLQGHAIDTDEWDMTNVVTDSSGQPVATTHSWLTHEGDEPDPFGIKRSKRNEKQRRRLQDYQWQAGLRPGLGYDPVFDPIKKGNKSALKKWKGTLSSVGSLLNTDDRFAYLDTLDKEGVPTWGAGARRHENISPYPMNEHQHDLYSRIIKADVYDNPIFTNIRTLIDKSKPGTPISSVFNQFDLDSKDFGLDPRLTTDKVGELMNYNAIQGVITGLPIVASVLGSAPGMAGAPFMGAFMDILGRDAVNDTITDLGKQLGIQPKSTAKKFTEQFNSKDSFLNRAANYFGYTDPFPGEKMSMTGDRWKQIMNPPRTGMPEESVEIDTSRTQADAFAKNRLSTQPDMFEGVDKEMPFGPLTYVEPDRQTFRREVESVVPPEPSFQGRFLGNPYARVDEAESVVPPVPTPPRTVSEIIKDTILGPNQRRLGTDPLTGDDRGTFSRADVRNLARGPGAWSPPSVDPASVDPASVDPALPLTGRKVDPAPGMPTIDRPVGPATFRFGPPSAQEDKARRGASYLNINPSETRLSPETLNTVMNNVLREDASLPSNHPAVQAVLAARTQNELKAAYAPYIQTSDEAYGTASRPSVSLPSTQDTLTAADRAIIAPETEQTESDIPSNSRNLINNAIISSRLGRNHPLSQRMLGVQTFDQLQKIHPIWAEAEDKAKREWYKSQGYPDYKHITPQRVASRAEGGLIDEPDITSPILKAQLGI